MSFDLAVWFEPAPITDEQAAAKYETLCETDLPAVPTQPQVAAFYQELTARFPGLDQPGAEGLDDSPWSSGPSTTAAAVLLAIAWSRADELARLVAELATHHGLVYYNPQSDVIRQPETGAEQLHIFCANGSRSVEPGPADIERILRRLNRNNWFAVLERADGWYVQVGDGEQAGTREGWYALERREGSADEHYRTNVSELDEVIAAFQQFAQGDDAWVHRFSWHQITV